jgi:hypothetical protein
VTDAYVPLTGPPTWQHAACRGEDPELFFPLGNPEANRFGETAFDVCHRCQHTEECILCSEAARWRRKRQEAVA